jgi:transposase InsO family protein
MPAPTQARNSLGLKHIFTKPYTPKTNRKAERFIQTALREWADATAYETSDQRAHDLPIWIHRQNWHRPHGSLNANTPISRLGLTEDNLLTLHTWSGFHFRIEAEGMLVVGTTARFAGSFGSRAR